MNNEQKMVADITINKYGIINVFISKKNGYINNTPKGKGKSYNYDKSHSYTNCLLKRLIYMTLISQYTRRGKQGKSPLIGCRDRVMWYKGGQWKRVNIAAATVTPECRRITQLIEQLGTEGFKTKITNDYNRIMDLIKPEQAVMDELNKTNSRHIIPLEVNFK